jgi:hypothetical protein
LILNKQERLTVVLPSIKSLHPVDTTYVVKLEDTTNIEMNESSPIAIIPIAIIPSDHSSHISSREIEQSPMYSQPNLPARLYFSPTILHDEESESMKNILSPLDQNQTSQNKQYNNSELTKPKVIIPRFGQTFLLDNIKTDENNETCVRPKIIDQIPFMIDSIPSQELCK